MSRSFKFLLLCSLILVFSTAFRIAAPISLSLAATPAATAEGVKVPSAGFRPDAPPYALHGPFWVGTREFTIPDKDGKRPLPVTVWYPALNMKGLPETNAYEATYVGSFLPSAKIIHQGHALRDATGDSSGGPYPLVVFSHGNSWTRLGYINISEHLASYGFVVIAVDHTGNTISEGGTNELQAIFYRPHDVTRTMDFAETLTATGGALAGLIDAKNVVVAGHSDGALTALLAGGARMNMKEASALCVGSGPHTGECDEWLTNAGRVTMAKAAGLEAEPTDGLYPNYGNDLRVKALIPLAASGEVEMSSDFTAFTKPTLLILGSNDRFNPLSGEERIYQNLPAAQKSMVILANADHFIYGMSCPDVSWSTSPDWYFLCSDSVWDMDRAHDLIDHFSTAFLLDVLKGDKEAHKALLPEAVKFPGIEYKTTMK